MKASRVFFALRDKQEDLPLHLCAQCQCELYCYDAFVQSGSGVLCPSCAEAQALAPPPTASLSELAQQYQAEAETLHVRIATLRKELPTLHPSEKQALQYRLYQLETLYRENRDLAKQLAHYYEGKQTRHGKSPSKIP